MPENIDLYAIMTRPNGYHPNGYHLFDASFMRQAIERSASEQNSTVASRGEYK